MRHDKIDIPKSKQKGRVIRKTWLIEPIFDFLTYVVLVGAYPLLSGLFFFDQLENGDYIIGASVLFGLALILGGLLLYSIINLDRLKRISGTLKDGNREAVKNLTEKLGWTLQIHNQQVSILSPAWSWFSTNWGRQIVVIYDRQDILINSTSYGLHDLKSPFHWFGNRKLEKIIKDNFEEEIKKRHANNGYKT
ncbi:hypothetical protein [Aequorivita marisscotiae]|uniref:YcxB family protein n=2 Tax=Flavobacteriaceae TaxID=49546 RepID=A0ABY8KZT7_9FLAO|nr:hypothetical protein [Aequorivita sp. Ant34-E75]WGF94014.1 hypothetical protein QCQ61_07430 [Aequorivita sp. Ant34-E75]